MSRPRVLAAVAAVALVTLVWALVPPAARRLSPPPEPRVVRGAIHVHTIRSDGTGTPDEIAAAAHRAGLDFVVLTDHGDGRRPPDPPRYVDGVLLIDAVEISTTGGHYVALGIGQAPYRLAGEPRDVIEDVHRLGGFGIAAHPTSQKSALRWREWMAPFDGIEWINADSEWRDEGRPALAKALLTYWIRAPESIVRLFDRPELTLTRWDAATLRRPVFAIGGLDAHARLPLGVDVEPRGGGGWRSLRVPSYEAAFRTMSTVATLDAPPGRVPASAQNDARLVLNAIRHGRTCTVIDALAGPARLDFTASGPSGRAPMGAEIADEGAVTLTADLVPPTDGATLVLFRNGVETARARGAHLESVHPAAEGPSVYRVEAHLDGAPGDPPVPWIVGNPIAVTRGRARSIEPLPPPVESETVVYPGDPAAWAIERHAESRGDVRQAADRAGSPALAFTWTLAGGVPNGQYAALVRPIDGRSLAAAGINQVEVAGEAAQPMRVSVQVRVPAGQGLRWARSIYLDATPRTIRIPLREMTPIEAPPGAPLDLARADSLLIVVDTVNTPPGSAGETWVTRVAWQRTARR